MATKYGTSGNFNPLRGTSENDFLYGFAGDDLIIKDDGDDYVEAGDGDDQVNGYPGLKGAYTGWTDNWQCIRLLCRRQLQSLTETNKALAFTSQSSRLGA
jgi:Ca2+-binding RTX toxin-like protein